MIVFGAANDLVCEGGGRVRVITHDGTEATRPSEPAPHRPESLAEAVPQLGVAALHVDLRGESRGLAARLAARACCAALRGATLTDSSALSSQ